MTSRSLRRDADEREYPRHQLQLKVCLSIQRLYLKGTQMIRVIIHLWINTFVYKLQLPIAKETTKENTELTCPLFKFHVKETVDKHKPYIQHLLYL